MKFRELTVDEIETRVASVKDDSYGKGCQVILYNKAISYMNILDECVGVFNWKREHKELKGIIYAGVSIWDDAKQQWITKWDCGKESNSESEKGESSDSFKRACVCWGIGRELYTAPFIWFNEKQCNVKDKKCYDKFSVMNIEYENGSISYLEVVNKTTGSLFTWGRSKTNQKQEVDPEAKISQIMADAFDNRCGSDEGLRTFLFKKYRIENFSELTNKQANSLNLHWDEAVAKYKGE